MFPSLYWNRGGWEISWWHLLIKSFEGVNSDKCGWTIDGIETKKKYIRLTIRRIIINSTVFSPPRWVASTSELVNAPQLGWICLQTTTSGSMWETRRGVNLAFVHDLAVLEWRDGLFDARSTPQWFPRGSAVFEEVHWMNYGYWSFCQQVGSHENTCTLADWGWENIPQPEHQHGEGCTLQ